MLNGLVALAFAASPVIAARAQRSTSGAVVNVSGVAFDSLAMKPLVGALVSVEGTGRAATSDDKGRFRVDSVPVGMRMFTLQHVAFDSAGLSGASARVDVRRDMPRVTMALPSFATLWRAVCGNGAAPKDSVLVYGTVRDAKSLEAAADVAVMATWVDLVGGGKSLASVGQRRWRRNASTDERGEYALCGVPGNTALSVSAAVEADAPTTVELDASTLRVRRRDLLVARPTAATALLASTPRDTGIVASPAARLGSVTGVITNAAGLAIANAAVVVDTLPEVRSGADGRFAVHGVPAGTRTVSVVAIGLQPYRSTVDLREGDTARLVVPMTSVQTLSEVNVRAKANTVFGMRERMIDEHKALGLGTYRDSTEIAKHTSMRTVLNTIPSIEIRGTTARFTVSAGHACPPGKFTLILDGHPSQMEELGLLDTRNVAMMEVYKRLFPSDLLIPKACTIVVWTKGALGK